MFVGQKNTGIAVGKATKTLILKFDFLVPGEACLYVARALLFARFYTVRIWH